MIVPPGRLRIDLIAKKLEPFSIFALGMKVSNQSSHFPPGYGASIWEKISIEKESGNVTN